MIEGKLGRDATGLLATSGMGYDSSRTVSTECSTYQGAVLSVRTRSQIERAFTELEGSRERLVSQFPLTSTCMLRLNAIRYNTDRYYTQHRSMFMHES